VFFLVLLATATCLVGWWYWVQYLRDANVLAAPRPVDVRNSDFVSEEKTAIRIYTEVRHSVVHIMNLGNGQTVRGSGSGFVWDEDGHVVTNFHVVQDAAAIVVVLDDHSDWRATLVGSAADKDLAVLRISAPKSKLHPIRVGSSHDLQVGQNAYALGNPYGLDQSFSRGIVSALGREIDSSNQRTIKNVIQTDAAVNPGNSGGPLLDSDGRLIGVTTAIYSPSGANAGIGFAIPVDEVNRVVPQLIQHGRIIRPGLAVVTAPDQLARRYGVSEGALIWRVAAGSTAAKAGLRGTRRDDWGRVVMGDVIVAVDQKSVESGNELYAVLENYKIGDTVTLTILRDDERQQVQVSLEGVG